MTAILQPFANLVEPGSYQLANGGALTVDWTAPLAFGLTGCWVPGVTGALDLSGNNNNLTTDTGAAFGGTPEGPGLKSTAANSGYYSPALAVTNPLQSSTIGLTLFWRGLMLGAPPSFGGFIAILLGVLDNPPFTITEVRVDNAGNFQLTSNSTQATGTAIPTSGMHSYCATLTTTTQRGYVDGVQNCTNTVSLTTNSNAVFYINDHIPQSDNRWANAVCTLACAWGRPLSAGEVMGMHLNPYNFLAPAEYEMQTAFFPVPTFTLMPQIVT